MSLVAGTGHPQGAGFDAIRHDPIEDLHDEPVRRGDVHSHLRGIRDVRLVGEPPLAAPADRPTGTNRLDHIAARLRGTWRYAFRQEKMDYYNPAGMAHKLIFTGFVVLLLRTLMLWGRGFYAPFDLLVLAPAQPLGAIYEFAKDIVATGVVVGTLRLLLLPPRRQAEAHGALAARACSSSASSSR